MERNRQSQLPLDDDGQAYTEYIIVVAAVLLGLIVPARLLGQALLAYHSMQLMWLKMPFP